MRGLAGVRSRGEQRVVTQDVGVAVAGTFYLVSEHFTDRGVDVDGHGLVARTGPEGPGARQQHLGHPVQLAHVAEGEAAKERAGRGTPSLDERALTRWRPNAVRRRRRCTKPATSACTRVATRRPGNGAIEIVSSASC